MWHEYIPIQVWDAIGFVLKSGITIAFIVVALKYITDLKFGDKE